MSEMTDSKAVEALKQAAEVVAKKVGFLAIEDVPELIEKLNHNGYQILPRVTNERLREAVAYITPAEMNHGAIMLTADKLREHAKTIEAALSELEQLRAIVQEFMGICDKAPPVGLMNKIAELRAKLPTPPKEAGNE